MEYLDLLITSATFVRIIVFTGVYLYVSSVTEKVLSGFL